MSKSSYPLKMPNSVEAAAKAKPADLLAFFVAHRTRHRRRIRRRMTRPRV